MSLTVAQENTGFRLLGWRIRYSKERVQVVRNFQRGWNLGPQLAIDGVVGPKTEAALLKSVARHKAGLGDASSHFSFSEFRCKCGGRFDACQRIWTFKGLLHSLELLRQTEGPLRPFSGCRCTGWNNLIPNAATYSQHRTGTACDIDLRITYRRLAAKDLFAGIGYAGSTGAVDHVDRRDLVGSRSGRGNPMIWKYRW